MLSFFTNFQATIHLPIPSLPPSQLTAAVVLTASVPAAVEATAAPVSARDAREPTARVDPAASAPRNAALDVPSERPRLLQTLSRTLHHIVHTLLYPLIVINSEPECYSI